MIIDVSDGRKRRTIYHLSYLAILAFYPVVSGQQITKFYNAKISHPFALNTLFLTHVACL